MASRIAAAPQVDSLQQRSGIVDMRCVGARELDALLLEETAEWKTKLNWDFSKVAGLVRRLAEARKLSGVVLLDRGEAVGCAYAGVEEDKGLIVDVYVRSRWRTANAEALLFHVMLDALIGTPGVRRVESQLMLPGAFPHALLAGAPLRRFDRLLLQRDANTPLAPGRACDTQKFQIHPWRDDYCDAAAAVVSLAYAGHIDAEISEHYRTLAGAGRLVTNLVHVQGSDTFCGPASFVAFDRATGSPAGLALTSFVADGTGHISELSVVPDARGAGLGHELLRQSVAALRAAGANRIGLTVTADNRDAVRLYARSGFREVHRFFAYLWERAIGLQGIGQPARPIANRPQDDILPHIN